jgi:hypothetical protein
VLVLIAVSDVDIYLFGAIDAVAAVGAAATTAAVVDAAVIL